MTAVFVVVAAALLALGVPVAFAVGISGLAALLADGGIPLEVVPQRAFAALDSFVLLAVPLFILAGELMHGTGMARSVLALVSRVPAGLPAVSVVSSMCFAAISGSSSASTAAVGSVMIPAMRRRGYPAGFAAAFQAAGGALGPVIPPSIVMIVVGHLTGAPIAALFLGGVGPGLLLAAVLLAGGTRAARRFPGGNPRAGEDSTSPPPLVRAVLGALPGVLLPVVVLGGILSGAFTATEAAGIAVAWVVLAGLLSGSLSASGLRRALTESALRSGVILFVATTAYLLAWILAVEQVAASIGSVLGAAASPLLFLLACNLVLIVAGMMMETISALIVALPVLFPLALQLGVDPVHFGVLVSVNLSIGMVTPPYGATLFVACSLSGLQVREVASWTLRPVLLMLAAQLVITLWPDSVLALPRVLGLLS